MGVLEQAENIQKASPLLFPLGGVQSAREKERETQEWKQKSEGQSCGHILQVARPPSPATAAQQPPPPTPGALSLPGQGRTEAGVIRRVTQWPRELVRSTSSHVCRG